MYACESKLVRSLQDADTGSTAEHRTSDHEGQVMKDLLIPCGWFHGSQVPAPSRLWCCGKRHNQTGQSAGEHESSEKQRFFHESLKIEKAGRRTPITTQLPVSNPLRAYNDASPGGIAISKW